MRERKFDRVDRLILDELQEDSSVSTIELAERVGLSQSPCWRRVQRLKDEGIIKKSVAILDRSKLDNLIYIYAYLRMATLSEEERHEFIREIETTPEILEAYTVFGEMDLMLKIIAPNVEWYQDFIFEKIHRLPGVLDIQSTITLKELKSTTKLPIDFLHTSSE
ncbi:MAG TPA: Lrp/AsnC family transcriptional regulator [Wenzhouxiangella sp.]|nr:Lrp/AsnC family transcriptional regulator [Wenzhouxiangella sp.]